jgi:hypothetical protein
MRPSQNLYFVFIFNIGCCLLLLQNILCYINMPQNAWLVIITLHIVIKVTVRFLCGKE